MGLQNCTVPHEWVYKIGELIRVVHDRQRTDLNDAGGRTGGHDLVRPKPSAELCLPEDLIEHGHKIAHELLLSEVVVCLNRNVPEKKVKRGEIVVNELFSTKQLHNGNTRCLKDKRRHRTGFGWEDVESKIERSLHL